MNAIVFSGVGETTYTKVPKPKIQGPNDVLMKIEAASICGTDVAVYFHGPGTGHKITVGEEFGCTYTVNAAILSGEPGDRARP